MPSSLSAGIGGASVPFKSKLRTETTGMHSARKRPPGAVVVLLSAVPVCAHTVGWFA